MPVRIDSSDYNNIASTYPTFKKFDSLRYSIVGSAVYVTVSAQVTSWNYTFLVYASATATASGVSAGGVDSLRTSFAKPTALTIVTDEAVTATAFFRDLKTKQILNPTSYLMDVTLVKAV